jgi:hypothetical protein
VGKADENKRNFSDGNINQFKYNLKTPNLNNNDSYRKIKSSFYGGKPYISDQSCNGKSYSAGGTGSKMLIALMEMNHSLIELGHAGLQVRLWDDDIVTHANEGRQRFAQCEVGLSKAVALINRANRWSGTNWKQKSESLREIL